MGVNRFEDLRVWKAAKQQCDRVGELRKRPEFVRDNELSSQMNGAALSVLFNISEGFLRRRDKAIHTAAVGIENERSIDLESRTKDQ